LPVYTRGNLVHSRRFDLVNFRSLPAALPAVVFVLALAAPAAMAQSEQTFSSLEERMTGSEFNAAGLHKLSPAELAALNRWIRARSLATRDEAVAGDGGLPSQPGRLPPIDEMAREPFQTRIVGEFSGWTGETVFELENGMVWKQAENRTFFVPPVENPVVTISPGFGGSWRLKVDGHNTTVRVERIE